MLRLFGTALQLLDASKLERVQRKFAALCFSRFFTRISYNYGSARQLSKLHTRHIRRHNLDALFFRSCFLRPKFCPSLIDNSSLRVPPCNIRDFTQFSVVRKNCPSARRATAANMTRSDMDIFSKQIRLLKQILS
jgi:hypothetical protein